MANYDIPNEEELQPRKVYNYDLAEKQYPISENNTVSTYNQFIQLRDTLVFSNKYYADKAGRSLIIGTKLDGTPTDTIEIREPNLMRVDFQPNGTVVPHPTGQYIVSGNHPGITCEIVKTGRYRIQHKEQFNDIDQNITRIHCYVVQHKTDGSTQSRAVFDWEWNTPGELKRITSFGYVECDLYKGEWLELKLEDQNGSDIQSEAMADSNWRMVEYIDLAYNN